MKNIHGYLLLGCLVALLGCDHQASTSNSGVDPEYARQTKEAAKQLEVSAKQQEEAQRQLENSAKQAERFEKLLQRWEQQADREDRLLDRQERQAQPPADAR
jgi:light-regulated signal transduction histidine kinase (bacteriophytochrome)